MKISIAACWLFLIFFSLLLVSCKPTDDKSRSSAKQQKSKLDAEHIFQRLKKRETVSLDEIEFLKAEARKAGTLESLNAISYLQIAVGDKKISEDELEDLLMTLCVESSGVTAAIYAQNYINLLTLGRQPSLNLTERLKRIASISSSGVASADVQEFLRTCLASKEISDRILVGSLICTRAYISPADKKEFESVLHEALTDRGSKAAQAMIFFKRVLVGKSN